MAILNATNLGGVRPAHSFAVAALPLPPREPQMKTRLNDPKGNVDDPNLWGNSVR
jgi:hypothetical protein